MDQMQPATPKTQHMSPPSPAATADARVLSRINQAFFARYGALPALRLMDRLTAERPLLLVSGMLRHYDVLRRLMAYAEKFSSMVHLVGFTPSFSAYLLGLTPINPTAPHTYCPDCHRVVMRPDVQDGWDLPEARCTCGCPVVRDGHDLPLTGLLSSMRQGLRLTIQVPPSFAEQALHFIREAYAPTETLTPCTEDEGKDVRSFRLTLPGATAPQSMPAVRFDIACVDALEQQVHLRHQLGFRPTAQTLLTPALLSEVMTRRTRRLALSLADEATLYPTSVSLLLQLDALRLGDGTWSDALPEALRRNNLSLMALPATEEDIFHQLRDALPAECEDGGLARHLAQAVASGRFAQRGQSDAEYCILQAAHLPAWCVEYLLHIRHALSRAELLHGLLDEMTSMWFAAQATEACDDA